MELLALEALTGYLALSLVVNYSWRVVVKSNLEGGSVYCHCEARSAVAILVGD